MATDKKSFLLYTDLIYTIKQLPDEKAGQLFKFILSYVNDEHPTTDDLILNLTFEPIKQQFKRDLIKYEVKREGYAKAGRASAEARKQSKVINETKQTLTDSTNVKNVEIETPEPVKSNPIPKAKPVKKDPPIKTSKAKDQISVKLPFETLTFTKAWTDWKVFKLEQHGFKYKSDISEGLILRDLSKLAGGDEFKAIQLIELAIAKGWKGFHDSNSNNTNFSNNGGNQNNPTPTTGNRSSDSISRNLDRFIK